MNLTVPVYSNILNGGDSGMTAWSCITLAAGALVSMCTWFTQRYFANRTKVLRDRMKLIGDQLSLFYWPLYFKMQQFLQCKKYFKSFKSVIDGSGEALSETPIDVEIDQPSFRRPTRLSIDESKLHVVDNGSIRIVMEPGPRIIDFDEAKEQLDTDQPLPSRNSTGSDSSGTPPDGIHVLREQFELGTSFQNPSPDFSVNSQSDINRVMGSFKLCFKKHMIALLVDIQNIIIDRISIVSPNTEYATGLLGIVGRASIVVTLDECGSVQDKLYIPPKIIDITFEKMKKLQKEHNRISRILS